MILNWTKNVFPSNTYLPTVWKKKHTPLLNEEAPGTESGNIFKSTEEVIDDDDDDDYDDDDP